MFRKTSRGRSGFLAPTSGLGKKGILGVRSLQRHHRDHSGYGDVHELGRNPSHVRGRHAARVAAFDARDGPARAFKVPQDRQP